MNSQKQQKQLLCLSGSSLILCSAFFTSVRLYYHIEMLKLLEASAIIIHYVIHTPPVHQPDLQLWNERFHQWKNMTSHSTALIHSMVD